MTHAPINSEYIPSKNPAHGQILQILGSSVFCELMVDKKTEIKKIPRIFFKNIANIREKLLITITVRPDSSLCIKELNSPEVQTFFTMTDKDLGELDNFKIIQL
jgi:hypothetical protein